MPDAGATIRRGAILKALDTAFEAGNAMAPMLLEQAVTAYYPTSREFERDFDYLIKKGLVTWSHETVAGQRVGFCEITPAGIDIVEGSVRDAGIEGAAKWDEVIGLRRGVILQNLAAQSPYQLVRAMLERAVRPFYAVDYYKGLARDLWYLAKKGLLEEESTMAAGITAVAYSILPLGQDIVDGNVTVPGVQIERGR